MATLTAVDDLTAAEHEAMARLVDMKIVSVQEVQYPEDQYFLQGLKESSKATFRGALVNMDLIHAVAAKVALDTVPVLEPIVVHLGGAAGPDEADLRRLETGGHTRADVAAVAARAKARTKFVFLPRVNALPIVATGADGARTVVGAIAIPCGMDRTLTARQGLPQFAAAMLAKLGEPTAEQRYVEYWFAPMHDSTPNVKLFALRFANEKRRALLQCTLLPFYYAPAADVTMKNKE
jgi:hypothetical protein